MIHIQTQGSPLEEQLIGGEYLEWELGLISETLRRLMTEEIKIPTLWKGYEVEEGIRILRTYFAPFHQLENEEIKDIPYPMINCPPDHVIKIGPMILHI